jgi:amino acid transporter
MEMDSLNFLFFFFSLPLSIVTTSRKFFSVFISAVLLQTPLTLQQWLATAVIFLALFLDTFFGKKSKTSEETPEESAETSEVIETVVNIYQPEMISSTTNLKI